MNPNSQIPEPKEGIQAGKRMAQVLVVDDEPLVCWSLERVLTKAGFRVIKAESGEKAIENLRSQPVDVVITDMKLPHLDGFAVALEAKRRLPDTPVIMISAFGDSASRQKAKDMSIEYFIDKPFDLAAMTSLVASILSCRPKRML